MLAEHKTKTLAHQLAGILGVYAESFEAWCADPSDVGRYERTRANLDLVRVLTDKAFPGGRGELGELLLYHGDLKLLVLKRHMARSAGRALRAGAFDQIQLLRVRHDQMVEALRLVCLQRSGQLATREGLKEEPPRGGLKQGSPETCSTPGCGAISL